MSDEERTEFDEFCRYERNNSDIHRWLVERGYKIDFSSVCNWRRANFPVGNQAESLNTLAKRYDGLEGDRSLQTIEGIAITLIHQITQTYQQAPNKLDGQILKLFAMLPSLMRESRSSAAQREEMRFIKDRASHQIAGAQRMADILIQTFEGTSFEDALREAVQGAMMQVEQEARGGQ